MRLNIHIIKTIASLQVHVRGTPDMSKTIEKIPDGLKKSFSLSEFFFNSKRVFSENKHSYLCKTCLAYIKALEVTKRAMDFSRLLLYDSDVIFLSNEELSDASDRFYF